MKENLKKKTIIYTSIVAIVFVIIIGAVIFFNISRIEVVNDFTIELGEQIPNNATEYLKKGTDKKIIDNATVKINDLDEELDFPDVGEYTVEICYKNRTKKVIVTVKDTTPPVFTDQISTVDIFTNETVNYQELFAAEDLSDVVIPLEIDDSEVDYSKAGTYTITVKVRDGYSNETTKEVTLNITQATPDPAPNNNTSSGNNNTNSDNSGNNNSGNKNNSSGNKNNSGNKGNSLSNNNNNSNNNNSQEESSGDEDGSDFNKQFGGSTEDWDPDNNIEGPDLNWANP